MVDDPSFPGGGDRKDDGSAPDSPSGTPRWVKVSALVVLAVVVLFVILLLAGAHDPNTGRH